MSTIEQQHFMSQLTSAVLGPGPGDVTNGDTGPDRCQQSSHPPVHALEAAAGGDTTGHNTTHTEDQILFRRRVVEGLLNSC